MTPSVASTDTNDIVLKNSADYVDIHTSNAATNSEIYVCDITTQTESDMLAVAGCIDIVLLKNETQSDEKFWKSFNVSLPKFYGHECHFKA